MGLSALASDGLAITENTIASSESDLDLSSSPDDNLPNSESTGSNGTNQEPPQNETDNADDEKSDSGSGLAAEEQPIPEINVVSEQMMLGEPTDGDILSISVTPEKVGPTADDSPKTVTVRIEMYNSTPIEYNGRVDVSFYKTTDNPVRSLGTTCRLDEDSTHGSNYVFVGTIVVPYYAYSGVYRLEFLDNWVSDIAYTTERFRQIRGTVKGTDMPESWIQSFEVEGGGVQDEQAPILKDIISVPESITMTGEASTAKIRLKVTDDLSGAAGIAGELFNPKYPDRDIDFEVKDPVTNYLSADGYYEADITIPKYASSGDYHLSYLYLEDQNENSREYYDSSLAEYYEDEPNTEELSSDLAKIVFTVTNSQGDNFSPILKSVSISPNQVSVGDAGTVIVALEVEDAGGSGFDPKSAEDNIIVQNPFAGGRLRSRFRFVSQHPGTNIYEYSETYQTTDTQKDTTYYVSSVSLEDFAGNSAFYRSTKIPRDGDIPLPNEAIMLVGNGGNNGGNSGGNSGGHSGGGGGGGGGGKGGGGGSGASANLVKAATVTKSATAAVTNSISNALKANLKTTAANISITAGSEISPATVKSVVNAINAAAKNKGVVITPAMTLTKTSAGKVVSSISFNPMKFTSLKNVQLGVALDDKASRTALSKLYRNNMQMVKFTQTGAFGMDVTVTAKLNLAGMNTKTLQFYTYDRTKKTLTPIAAPNYSIDKNGYLHFTTNMGNTVVITDSVLQKKA